jgi:hypothetical protein
VRSWVLEQLADVDRECRCCDVLAHLGVVLSGCAFWRALRPKRTRPVGDDRSVSG